MLSKPPSFFAPASITLTPGSSAWAFSFLGHLWGPALSLPGARQAHHLGHLLGGIQNNRHPLQGGKMAFYQLIYLLRF